MALRYEEFASGSGETVVLLHSLALDGSIWADFARRLPSGARVIAPDLPGHGRTPAGDPESIESMAAGVAELLHSLDLHDVTLIGMSLGGSVAQALTLDHPELVGRLGLVDTTAWYGPDAPAAWAARAEQAREKGLASLAAFQLERWFTDGFRIANPRLGAELLDIFVRNRIENYVKSCNAFGRMDLRARLGKIDAPTAVVVGELDGATPPAHADVLAHEIPGASLTVVPGCKHLSALERPDDVLAGLAAIFGSRA
jgi:3-oxoadipate enol-lactonase